MEVVVVVVGRSPPHLRLWTVGYLFTRDALALVQGAVTFAESSKGGGTVKLALFGDEVRV